MLLTVSDWEEYGGFNLSIHHFGVFYNPQRIIISSANRVLCDREKHHDLRLTSFLGADWPVIKF